MTSLGNQTVGFEYEIQSFAYLPPVPLCRDRDGGERDEAHFVQI